MLTLAVIKKIVDVATSENLQDAVLAAAPEGVGGRNDRLVAEEYKNQLEGMLLAFEERYWKDRKDSERPKAADWTEGLGWLSAAARRANNNRKRKLLWNAFWNSLKPEFYDEGISNILRAKVEELEYPDFIFMKRVLDETNHAKRHVLYQESVHQGGRGSWKGDQLPIRSSDEEAEFAERLNHQGLVDIEHSDTRGMLLISSKGLAPKLKKFALDEFEMYEAEKCEPGKTTS